MHKGNVCVSIDSPHLKLWDSYPTHKGYVKALEYVPRLDRPAYEAQWREWCKAHPKSEWPEHILNWAETKRRLEAAGK